MLDERDHLNARCAEVDALLEKATTPEEFDALLDEQDGIKRRLAQITFADRDHKPLGSKG